MKMAKRTLVVFFAFAFLASVCANVFLFKAMLSYYRQVSIVKLDPANAGVYSGKDVQVNAGEPSVVFLGDSRITRWRPFPSLAGCQTFNRGVGGETTAQMLLRLEKDVLALGPGMAVIQVGINDIKAIGLLPEKRAYIIDSCKRNIKEMVERLTARDISVVILTVIPPGKPELLRRPVWSDDIYTGVQKVNEAIRAMAGDKVIVLDCDTFMTVDGKIKPEYASDTLHFSRRGYEELDKHLEPLLNRLIENMND